jgi:radical SAM protein with 4Fe4S-binding SPASM domain
MSLAIGSLLLEEKEPIYYYPSVNVLSFDPNKQNLNKAAGEFAEVLFRFFIGIRKLKALSKAKTDPKVLFIEPWRTCNLTCSYCYAKAGPSITKKVNYDDVTSLIGKYNFSRVLFFGGEPLLDKDFVKNIYYFKQWENFFFSTNGILLNDETINQTIENANVSLQVSIEPPEWGKRVNNLGEKQFNLLRSARSLCRRSKVQFRITIPTEVPYVRLREIIDSIAQEIGSYDFGISYWPASGDELPEWFDLWVDESYQLIKSEESLKYRDKVLGYSLIDYFGEIQTEGFRFYNCNAAYGSVSIGPDGRLHGCHEKAIVEDKSDVISSSEDPLEIDKTRVTQLAYIWTNNMTNGECRVCQAKYFCGGVCFMRTDAKAVCIFLRKLLPLVLTQIIISKPNVALKIISKTETVFNKLYNMKDELKKQVMSETWIRLVSGELPLQRAAELALKYYGN